MLVICFSQTSSSTWDIKGKKKQKHLMHGYNLNTCEVEHSLHYVKHLETE